MLTQFPIGFAERYVATAVAATSLYARAVQLAALPNTAPTAGGLLVINGQTVGNHDYSIAGSTILASMVDAEWFTPTNDTVSSWVIIKGNLTINSGVNLRPNARKLFNVVYVTGNLTVSGTMSMRQRGANHSGLGNSAGLVEPVPIRIYNGSIGGFTNPTIPALGAAGGAALGPSTDELAGVVGGSSTSLIGTAGGGSGASGGAFNAPAKGGDGAQGTCFGGGAGGGGAYEGTAGNGGSYGGEGGARFNGAVRGAGNPGDFSATTGTGGVLIVIVEGNYSGAGNITSAGQPVSYNWQVPQASNSKYGGGGSGGGIAILMRRTQSNAPTITAVGAANTGTGGTYGGKGGDGYSGVWTLP